MPACHGGKRHLKQVGSRLLGEVAIGVGEPLEQLGPICWAPGALWRHEVWCYNDLAHTLPSGLINLLDFTAHVLSCFPHLKQKSRAELNQLC